MLPSSSKPLLQAICALHDVSCDSPTNDYANNSYFTVNPCRNEPCLNNALCVPDPQSGPLNFICICPPGFQGILCECMYRKSYLKLQVSSVLCRLICVN